MPLFFNRKGQTQLPGTERPWNLHSLWLLFAQAVTLLLAVLFVIAVFQLHKFEGNNNEFFGGDPATDITFSRSLSRILPSVVSIQTSDSDQDSSTTQINYNIGSGVIVSTAGHVITNHHVIDSSDNIEVITATGERIPAKLIGSDPEIDIAVLKVSVDQPLPAAKFKDRRTQVRVGDLVMSVGSPYGLPNTASLGIVSAVGRNALGLSRYEHFIQTDAAINHGSSGGALTNVHGELVGINTALFSKQLHGVYAQGIGFAIPVELVHAAYEQIVEHGRFKRGWIGLELSTLDPLRDSQAGIDAWVVKSVDPDSPSDRAGIWPGDLLVSINGRSPSAISFLEEATGELLRPGLSLELALERNGEPFTAFVQVLER